MTKPISRRQHAATDYSYIPLVSLAPGLAGFEDEPTAARLCRIASGTIAASSLLTRAEWGTVKVMPYKAHLAIDAALGAFSLAAPWLFGFARNRRARNTFLAMGLAGLSAGLLSRPNEMPPDAA